MFVCCRRRLHLHFIYPENEDGLVSWSPGPQGAEINLAACDLAREVADEGNALVAGGVSQTPSYLSCKSKADVKAIFQKQLDVFSKKEVDFLIAEVRCPAARGGGIGRGEAHDARVCNRGQLSSSHPPLSKNWRRMRLLGSIVM